MWATLTTIVVLGVMGFLIVRAVSLVETRIDPGHVFSIEKRIDAMELRIEQMAGSTSPIIEHGR